MMNRVLFLAIISTFLSCNSIQYFQKSIETCKKNPDGYCLASKQDLKSKIGNKPLYYEGSDSDYDYFRFYYDQTMKYIIKYKVKRGQYSPKKFKSYSKIEKVNFNNDLVYCSDL